MVNQCQCRILQTIESDAGGTLLADFEAGAADPDWRVREFFAVHLIVDGARQGPEDASRWAAVERVLLTDPHKLVRMAAAFRLRRAPFNPQAFSGGSDVHALIGQLNRELEELSTLPLAAELDAWVAQTRGSLQEMELRGGPPADIADRELVNDRRWAAHNYDEAAPLLLDDPVCEVRADAVGRMLAHGPDPDLESRAGHDSCPRVRASVIRARGDRGVPDLGHVTRTELLAIAAVTTVPERLAELATHQDDTVRATVAANKACPGPLLTALYQDLVWDVWIAAKNNPSWPDGERIGDVLADHGTGQPIEPWKLAAAVVNTHTQVRCGEGRSRIYLGSGYLLPREDDPWLCDRDAVVLHSWGPFCWEHQQEVDLMRQSGGSDGYLGQRLLTGLWVRLGQGGPAGPVEKLWHAGQIYLHRPATLTSESRPAPKAPPPAVDHETEPADPAEPEPASGTSEVIDDESLAWRATHDLQTGLLNRATLMAIIEDPGKHPETGAVIVLDIGQLHAINDELSPAFGDQVITHVATHLTKHTPTSRIIARTGRGEFVVLLPDVSPYDAAQLVEHLFEDLRAPVRTPVGRVRFSVSAGCAHVRAGSTLHDALDRAFTALNRAKADGGGNYIIDPA